MFRFVKQIFVLAMMSFSCNVLNVIALKCVSINNQECKIRPQMLTVNVNSNEPLFHPYCVKTSKCINVKVSNLMSRTNETRRIEWHETCKCKFRLDASVCNNKQHWNKDKSRCECKESIDKGKCDNGFIWKPSNCECEFDKSCDIEKN